jgi:hypothetical protein
MRTLPLCLLTVGLGASTDWGTRQAAERLGVSHTVVGPWRAVNKTVGKRSWKPLISRLPRSADLLKFPSRFGGGCPPTTTSSSTSSRRALAIRV